jgi:hypothetical protein
MAGLQAKAGSVSAKRHYGLDWLRIGAFALLILYHIGIVFTHWPWLVKSVHSSDTVSFLLLAINPWRLELLFIVSGYASRALMLKLGGPLGFARARSIRLLVPLFFAIAVIIPPQEWVRFRFHHEYTQGFGHFWAHDYFRFGTLDGIPLPNWEHLWFVAYLWAYSMLLGAALLLLPEGALGRAQRWFDRLGDGNRLFWYPLIALAAIRVTLLFAIPESHGLFDDWIGHAIYLPAFLFGFALAGTDRLWPALARLWRPGLLLALLGYAVILMVEIRYPGEAVPPHIIMALARASRMAAMWGVVLVLLDFAHRRLNRDHPLRARLGEAVFPFYIMHQTAIVLIGWWLLSAHFSAPEEFALLLAGTTAACWLFYEIGRRIPVFRPLIGLQRQRRAPRPSLAAAKGAA